MIKRLNFKKLERSRPVNYSTFAEHNFCRTLIYTRIIKLKKFNLSLDTVWKKYIYLFYYSYQQAVFKLWLDVYVIEHIRLNSVEFDQCLLFLIVSF